MVTRLRNTTFFVIIMEQGLLIRIIAVGAGSAIGGIARYLVSLAMKDAGRGFPWGTLAVNLAGCLAIGLLWGVFSRTQSEGSNWALFLSVGLCGGFTTFSTFSKEALAMLQAGSLLPFAAYVAISAVAGISLVALGCWAAR